MALGEKLKGRRQRQGLTLGELNKASGVTSSHLGRIERGERTPSAAVLRALAKPLGCTEWELLKEAGYLSPDATDDRLARFKDAVRDEITGTMTDLLEKVDRL
ncbi:hypothetical protein LCGC14_2819050 [marine sediment metagenome]|uniref:HTH cro/C1-type domain-containing protein n=1 Tax=marine sediment metagenome TaxID=412755 RepID=A0A0F8YHK7_9ZZZZ